MRKPREKRLPDLNFCSKTSLLLYLDLFWTNTSILWNSSRIFFRAKGIEHFIEQVPIIAFYLKKNNHGRVFYFFTTRIIYIGIALTYFLSKIFNNKSSRRPSRNIIIDRRYAILCAWMAEFIKSIYVKEKRISVIEIN